MVGKKIIWSDSAKIEFRAILEFYAERNGSINYSNKILIEVQDLLQTLSMNSKIGRMTSNNKTRVIPLKVYLIFYELNENRIEIVSFWDNRQDTLKRKIK
ncbi:MAG: type II toxin-antitoxin system RelE/ParE family toxin [Flavobacteriales bacterium]